MFPENFKPAKYVNIQGDLSRLNFPCIAIPDINGRKFYTAYQGNKVVAFDVNLKPFGDKDIQYWAKYLYAGLEGIYQQDKSCHSFVITDDWFNSDVSFEYRWKDVKFYAENINKRLEKAVAPGLNFCKVYRPLSNECENIEDALKVYEFYHDKYKMGTVFREPEATYLHKDNKALVLAPPVIGEGTVVERSYRDRTLTVNNFDQGLFLVDIPSYPFPELGSKVKYSYIHQKGNPKPVNPQFLEQVN